MNRPVSTYFGVDFSGAARAGENTWVARVERRGRNGLRLAGLADLESLAGTADRAPALAHLVSMIRASEDALWAIDFPFSLPHCLLPDGSWKDLLAFCGTYDETGYHFGHWCLARAKKLGGRNHLPRLTDFASRAPFSCYHYRIAFQTFHGLRDVLLPLSSDTSTCIHPFQPRRLPRARRVVVEACPSSTLKRLGLPHQNYKQPAGGPLTSKRLRTRRRILDGLASLVDIPDAHCRTLMRNPGGDALDAVLAAVGAHHAWHRVEPLTRTHREEGLIHY